MKRTPNKSLRVRNLSQEALKKASGGRGTACGTYMHCDQCNAAWSFGCYGDPMSGYFQMWGLDPSCPNCGAANW